MLYNNKKIIKKKKQSQYVCLYWDITHANKSCCTFVTLEWKPANQSEKSVTSVYILI